LISTDKSTEQSDLLNRDNELKSILSTGRRFQIFTTLWLKNDNLAEQLLKWPELPILSNTQSRSEQLVSADAW